MKKIILGAAFLGILLGVTIFFSSPFVAEPPHVMLQNSVPQAKIEVGAVRGNQSDWPVAIGFLLGGLIGFSTFLVAKRRA